MKKIFTFLAAALMSVSMLGKTVTEDISMNPADWTWGYGSAVVADGDMLKCILTSEWGAMAIGWNEPIRDLSEWDKIVVVVENMNGCDGEWFKLKAYLRDYVNKDVEAGQMEATLGLDAEDRQQNYMVINLKEEGKNVNLTACGVLGIQCQPNGAEFKISRVYLEKEAEDVTTYTLQLVADSTKGSVAVTNLLGSDIIDNGNGNYTVPANAEVKILATPNEGYEFSGWKVGNRWCDFTECGTAVNTEDNPYTFTMTKDVAYKAEFKAAQPQMDETVIYVAFPSANRPEKIEVAGTFEAGAWGMRVFNGDWYTCNEDLYTSAEDILKFRDAVNHDIVLCQRIPANGEGEDKWVQLLLKCSDFAVVSWKGEMARVIDEQNFFDASNYAWMTGMPEPDPEGIENIVLTEKAQKVIMDGMIYIVRDGKLFNLTGAQVR